MDHTEYVYVCMFVSIKYTCICVSAQYINVFIYICVHIYRTSILTTERMLSQYVPVTYARESVYNIYIYMYVCIYIYAIQKNRHGYTTNIP
jgi:hypothetical protein